MKTNNKLDNSFGPAGSFAGRIVFVAAIILSCFYYSGALLVLIGGFVGFTCSSAIIDYDKKCVKFSNNLFGIIQTGNWIQIEPGMTIGIKKLNQTFTAYSPGNRSLDVPESDFRIILFDGDGKEIMPLKKTNSLDTARAERDTIGNSLGLKII